MTFTRAVDVTTIFVTHDQEEAKLADEIVVINKGRVEQVGTPAEIYDNPATRLYEFCWTCECSTK